MKENNITIQFQYVTWQLEKVIGNGLYEYFQISEEVQEQVMCSEFFFLVNICLGNMGIRFSVLLVVPLSLW